MPSSSSPASRAIGFGHRRPLHVPKAPQQFPALGVDDADRVREPGLGRGDELQVELGQVGLGPADLGEPFGDPLLAGRGELVDLAARSGASASLDGR